MSRRRFRRATSLVLAALVMIGMVGLAGGSAEAWGRGKGNPWSHWKKPGKGESFNHVATLDVMAANGSAVAEIVDVTKDGRTLVYTDAPQSQIGFVDIADPENPVGTGLLDLPGEPTSLVTKDGHVVVGVNTSPSFATPSGQVLVIDLATRAVVRTFDAGGQPDSLALAPSGTYLAVVVENERDEDVNDGLIPQLPSGGLLKLDVSRRNPAQWTAQPIDLSKVAATATDGTDLEPEFVDINTEDEAVVSFQENNHLAIVNLRSGKVVEQFPAGSVTVDEVDTEENDLLEFTSSVTKRREPDAVAWLGTDAFATANEGDYTDASGAEGGSRGFTVFDRRGEVRYDSGNSFEHEVAKAGQYPEARSENKGVEPEAVEYGRFGRTDYLFVGSERANVVGVYELKGSKPEFRQILPTGIGPEGVKAIPQRGLLVASTETDVADVGIPTMITIYRLEQGGPSYPQIESRVDRATGAPIPWVALSGLAADPRSKDTIYAVSDAFLAEGFVYQVDVKAEPAEIVRRTQITGASAGLDLEGIAVGADGKLWLGSEGNAADAPNLVLKADPATGAVLQEWALPAELAANARSNGIEGVAVTGQPGAEVVYVAIQRAWPASGDVDGVATKIGRLDTVTGEWTFVLYPLEPKGGGDWIGLSELTLLPDGTFAVVERDKGWGPTTGFVAELKAVYGIDLANADFRALDDPAGLATIDKGLLRDLIPDLEANSSFTPEKVEGVTVARDGQVYVVTDNDGVDDSTGETVFLRLGDWRRALAG
jgi:hypothetical protein